MKSSTEARFRQALRPRLNGYVKQAPTPRQQAALYLLSWNRELLYGGEPGGGKTSLMLMAALQYVDIPGYAALILRRTYPELMGADNIVERSHDWLEDKPCKWNKDEMTWTFPSGASLRFGHMQYEGDKRKYHGPAYQFIGFDETTTFLESQYTYMFSRQRRPSDPANPLSRVPIRTLCGSNPLGVGHDWVKARLRYPKKKGRVFLRARLNDNPYLDTEEYRESLRELHPFERQALLHGDWDARPPGARFKREWFEVVGEAPSDASGAVRFWDLAATEPKPGQDPDWSVGTRMVKRGDVYFITDVQRFRGSPQAVDSRLLQTAQIDGIGTKVVIEQEPGSSGKIAVRHFQRLLCQFACSGKPSTGDKVVRSNPFASAAERGDVKLVSGSWIPAWLEEHEMFTGNPKDTSHDDQVDSASGAYAELSTTGVGWDSILRTPAKGNGAEARA